MAIADQIAQLEELLDSATHSVAVDGIHTAFDLESARKRLAELKQQEASKTWPQAATIKLNRGFCE